MSLYRCAQEIQHVCKCAVERNSYQMAINARLQSFEAWRQLVEVLLTGCPADLLTGELRQNVIFELLQDLLDKAYIILLCLIGLFNSFIYAQDSHDAFNVIL